MREVSVQKLICEACSGPLEWDGKAAVIECPQCATPHAIRWNEGTTPESAPPAPPLSPQERLRRLDDAWKRTGDATGNRERFLAAVAAFWSFVLIPLIASAVDVPAWKIVGGMGLPWLAWAALAHMLTENSKVERQRCVGLYLEQRQKLLAEIKATESSSSPPPA